MLDHLYIRDFAIVQSLDLSLGARFTVLTGETGAGKSIIVDALALALGGRADASVVRHGRERAEIGASFALAPDHAATQWLRAHELLDDETCVLRRLIEKERPSKGFINGRPVPIQMLRELGALLVDIHGQHEHHSLLARDAQRDILDAYAGILPERATLARQHRELTEARAQRAALSEESRDRSARIELLRFQVQELERLALGGDELPQLEEEHERLAHAAELLEGAQGVAQQLYDDEDNALTRTLALAARKLEGLSRHDAKLEILVRLLNEASVQLDEAAGELQRYLERLDLDPARLAWVDQRLAALHELARKHRVAPAELPALLQRLQNQLAELEDMDVNLEKLDQRIANARAAYLACARAISQARTTAGERLARDVAAQMQRLGMPGGRFAVALTALPEDDAPSHGLEQVDFEVSANPGQPLRPLAKVASGGELSRISLALQVITAGLGQAPTLIFDEVDVGIGGGVAEIVGQQLAALGRQRQVLCITHQPQVAAQGDHHLQVSKKTQGRTTTTAIRALSKSERVQELARMLGGIEVSAKALAHAEELLAHVDS